MTTQEFFQDVIFEQNVKTKTRHFSMIFLKAEDFWQPVLDASIATNVEAVYILLYEYGFVEVEDVHMVQAWLSDMCGISLNAFATSDGHHSKLCEGFHGVS